MLQQAGQFAFAIGRNNLALELAIGQDGEDATEGRQIFVDVFAFGFDVEEFLFLGDTLISWNALWYGLSMTLKKLLDRICLSQSVFESI